ELGMQADVAHDRLAGLDTNACATQAQVDGRRAQSKCRRPVADLDCAVDRMDGMAVGIKPRIEERMDGIADPLVDYCSILDHARPQPCGVSARRRPEPRRSAGMRHGGEALAAGKQGGQSATCAVELEKVRLLHDAANDCRREMLLEPPPHPRFPS